MTTQPPDLKKLRELIGAYWACAYREGQQDRTHDTPSGEAQSLCNAIESELKGIAKVIDAYEASARDAERLDWIEREACTVQSATSGEDDLHYQIIDYYMTKPNERLIGFGATPREAIDAARHATQGD